MTFLYILAKSLFASVVSLGFGLVSNPPKRAMFAILITGFFGYFSRIIMIDICGFHIFLACLICSFLMGCLGLILGRINRTPATVIYIPALLPMIPGMYAYKAIFALINFMEYIEVAEKGVYLEQFFINITYTLGILACLALGSILPMFVFTRTANSLTRN